jgi:hypothetical protein
MPSTEVRHGDSVDLRRDACGLPAPAAQEKAPLSRLPIRAEKYAAKRRLSDRRPRANETHRPALQVSGVRTVGYRSLPRALLGALLVLAVVAAAVLLPVRARWNAHVSVSQELPAAGVPIPDPVRQAQSEAGEGLSEEARALSRLTRALAPLPAGTAPAALRQANEALVRSGAPPCTVESAAGEPALMVRSLKSGTARGDGGPLTAALTRCARALEQTLWHEDKPD